MKDHSEDFSVSLMSQVLAVSRNCYYQWLKIPESARVREDQELTVQLKQSFDESRQRIGRLMFEADLVVKTKRTFKALPIPSTTILSRLTSWIDSLMLHNPMNIMWVILLTFRRKRAGCIWQLQLTCIRAKSWVGQWQII